MRKSKRERLQREGWSVGRAKEFLGLPEANAVLIEMKLALSRSLRQLRRRRGLTQTEVAELLQSSQSRVAKMEARDPAVSMDLLVGSLLLLGGDTRDVARAIRGDAANSISDLH